MLQGCIVVHCCAGSGLQAKKGQVVQACASARYWSNTRTFTTVPKLKDLKKFVIITAKVSKI